MRLSYRWLRKYLNFEISTRDLTEAMIMSGFEVVRTIDLGYGGEPILVAEVREAVPHPTAEGVSLLKVATGEGPLRDVVWVGGAVSPGCRAPLALPGARLASGVEITERAVYGHRSEGLLCTGADLGWSADARRPLTLPEDYAIGQPVDFLLEIKPPTNRPDCLGVFGIARDIAARYNKKVYPPAARFSESLDHTESFISVALRARERCSRYTVRFVEDVRVGESPLWLRRALEAAGAASVNNIVDAVNYAVLDLGQPIMVYDMDKVAGNQIYVRLAEEGETVKLNNNLKVTLDEEDLVIADSTKVVALAGIMQSAATEVSESTVNVFLESALYSAGSIRRSARRLALTSDLSYRYERGVNRDKTPHGLNQATFLIKELAGGEVAKGLIDLSVAAPPAKPIALDLRRANASLGLQLKGREVADILVALGFEILHFDNDIMTINVPAHRVDVAREMDLIEEIARLYGYDKIPSTMPRLPVRPMHPSSGTRDASTMTSLMVSLGFSEVVSLSFLSDRQIESFGLQKADCLPIANPPSPETAALRPILAPSLTEAVRLNQDRGVVDLRLFEIARVYRRSSGEAEHQERLSLAAAMSGVSSWNWRAKRRPADYYDLKAVAERILEKAGLERVETPGGGPSFLHPGRSSKILANGAEVGWLGELHPGIAKDLGMKAATHLLEIDLSALPPAPEEDLRFEPLPRFPALERELTLISDAAAPAGLVEAEVRAAAGPLLEACSLFDVAEGAPAVPSGRKRMAFRLVLRAADRAVAHEEADALSAQIVKRLQAKFDVEPCE